MTKIVKVGTFTEAPTNETFKVYLDDLGQMVYWEEIQPEITLKDPVIFNHTAA